MANIKFYSGIDVPTINCTGDISCATINNKKLPLYKHYLYGMFNNESDNSVCLILYTTYNNEEKIKGYEDFLKSAVKNEGIHVYYNDNPPYGQYNWTIFAEWAKFDKIIPVTGYFTIGITGGDSHTVYALGYNKHNKPYKDNPSASDPGDDNYYIICGTQGTNIFPIMGNSINQTIISWFSDSSIIVNDYPHQ